MKLLLMAAIAFYSANILADYNSFNREANQRVVGELTANENKLVVEYYSNYLDDSFITIENNTSTPVRFRSEAGYLVEIAPNSRFKVPCVDNGVLSGRINFSENGVESIVYEDAICKDLIVVNN
jgi:hypothetical protein